MQPKRLLTFLALLLLPCAVQATTPVSGSLKDLGTNAVTTGAFVRFTLRGCGGNQPTVPGVAVLAGPGQPYYKDFVTDGSGNVSGTLYSTRDAAGTGNGEILCGTSYTSAWYGMTVWVGGKSGPEMAVHAKNGVTLDPGTVTPLTTNPVVTAPSGDSTYARLDGGNQPFTGNITLGGTTTVPITSKLVIPGIITNDTVNNKYLQWQADTTFSGDPAFQGDFTFSGYPNIGGSPIVTGNPTFTGTPVFSGVPLFTAGKGFSETVPPSAASNEDVCYGDSTVHTIKCSYNNGPFLVLPQTGNASGTHSDSGFYQTATAAGCTTAASIGGVCSTPITVTWPTSFSDTNYKTTCTPVGAATNLPSAPYVVTPSAASATVNYYAVTAAAASWPNVVCTAVHN